MQERGHRRAVPARDDVTCSTAVMARAATENFPVAPHLFPSRLRPHLLSVYGFARLVDQIGDEAGGDRLAQLAAVSADLDAIYAGRKPDRALLRWLGWTIRACGLPRDPFDRLIQANVQDQSVTRYETFDELLDYCRLSAQPVGELVLRMSGACSPEALWRSNSICTGLQLAEFWQDLGEDAAKGRVYIPLEDMRRFGYSEDDLLAGVTNEAFERLMAYEVAVAEGLLRLGRPLYEIMPGRLGFAVRLYSAGGLAALADLRRRHFHTLTASAHAAKARTAVACARELALRHRQR
jgi:squalene synthase HpnC